MNKRILAAILSFLISISTVGVMAQENTARDSYARDIELVRSLGIMQGYDDGSFGENNNITRMEYTAVIVRLLGHESIVSGYKPSSFTDVSVDSWGSGYVSVASDFGLVDGNGDGTFSPENNVTFNQALKIMVSALGYKLMAEAKGGYPSGYLNVANTLGITKGVNNRDTALTRGQIAKLISNSLEAEVAEQGAIKSNGDYSLYKSDKTLLSELDFYKKEGIVTAVYGANTSNYDFELEKNQIVIGNELLDTEIEDCSAFILRRVVYYGKENEDGNDTVYFIQQFSYGQDEIVIEAENIEEDFTNLSQIRYLKNKKWYTQKLPEEIVIVYNGKVVSTSDYSDELMKIKSGSITLIDADRNGSYEYAIVDEYENYMTEAVMLPKIYDSFSKVLNLDEEDDVRYSVYYNGAKVSPEIISEGDVLSVAKSLDGKNVRILVSKENITGYIDEHTQDELGNITYLIDGKEYSFAENYSRAYKENNAKLKKLSAGDSAIFYIDVFGKIAGSTPVSIEKSGFYGYLIDASKPEGLGAKGAEIQIMTAENKFEIFKVAEKVLFGRNSGSAYKTERMTPSDMYTYLLSDGKVNMQMVKYSLDGEGNVNRLYLADKTPYSENFSLDVSRNSRFYANGVYGGEYILNNDTAWFDIPESGLYTDLFSAGYAPDFLKANSSYTLELYDVEDNVAKAVYSKSSSPRYTTYSTKVIIDSVNSPVMMIDKVSYTEIDGYTRMCVSGYAEAQYVTVPVSDELMALSDTKKNLKRGVIIQYETNYAEKNRAETSEELEVMWVYNVLHDFNITTKGLYRMWENTYVESNNAGIGTIFGVVTDVSFPYFTVRYNDEDGNEESAILQIGTQTQTYSYDRNGSIWKEINQREVQLGEILFIRTRYNRIREIVILKN